MLVGFAKSVWSSLITLKNFIKSENKHYKTILITNSKKLLITQIIFCTLIIIFFSIVITLGILPNSWELTKEITENVLKWTGKQGIFILSGFSLILLITLVIKPKLILTYFQYWIGIITMIIISFGILDDCPCFPYLGFDKLLFLNFSTL